MTVAILGFSFVPMKVGLRELPPFALCALRFLFAAIPLVFFVKPPRIPWIYVVGYGVAIGVFQFGLLFLGIAKGMPAGLASLVIQVQVFFTIGLGIVFLRDRLQRHNLIGAAIAGLGLALLAIHKVDVGDGATLLGFALVIAAAMAWAVGIIVAKRAASAYAADMFALVVWSSLAAPIPLAILSYAFEGGAAVGHALLSASALTWGCALFMAWGATLFGFATWARLMHRYPTALFSPFALLIPVTGLASGLLFLGESLSALQAAGAIVVFVGLAVNIYGARPARTPVSLGEEQG
ncbi:MAG: EamA family transporter [Betaproteobacteria bacterium]